MAITAATITLLLVLAALAAPWIAPSDATDPATANVIDARLPPGATGMLGARYLLGTDPQGRDLLSAILYGLRTSLVIGIGSVMLAASIGVLLGLVSGYFGGKAGAIIMHLADVQLSFPAILIALLVDGVSRTVLARDMHDRLVAPILIVSIASSYWVQYARTVRGLVLVERNREYILAARITGVSTRSILAGHILPNVVGPVLVIATINLSLAILTEATLSFLGVGVPPSQPSLGSLVRIGNEFLFSGDWWISMLPGAVLVMLCLAVNLFGDWLRDALNPRLAGS
jgi:peptide/nickel transport system permease protein